ncbi:hypothetical protein RYX36_025678, partial [Vicia faba]
MAKFLNKQKYFVIFVVLITYHIFLPTQARKIKPSFEGQLKNLKPTIPAFKTNVNAPSPTFESKFDTSLMPYKIVASIGDSNGDTDAFRPTTPGSSPGVGHRKFGEDKDMK